MRNILKIFKSNQLGNVLIQIPVVFAIVGGLATFSAQNAAEIIPEARDVRRSADAYQITLALNMYAMDYGMFPQYVGDNPEASWDVLTQAIEPEYIQKLPNDPLFVSGNLYQYRYWSDGTTAKVFYLSEIQNTTLERWAY